MMMMVIMIIMTNKSDEILSIDDVFLSMIGGGGILYGFLGANSSRESRTKFMSYFRVSCMAGVLLSTIGKLARIVAVRTAIQPLSISVITFTRLL